MSSYNNQLPKGKNRTVKSKKSVSNSKRKKKAADRKKGCQTAKIKFKIK